MQSQLQSHVATRRAPAKKARAREIGATSGTSTETPHSEKIVDDALRYKVAKYEQKIAALEVAGEIVSAQDERKNLEAFLQKEYRKDASRWVRPQSNADVTDGRDDNQSSNGVTHGTRAMQSIRSSKSAKVEPVPADDDDSSGSSEDSDGTVFDEVVQGAIMTLVQAAASKRIAPPQLFDACAGGRTRVTRRFL